MAQETITYIDKETFRTSPLPVEQKMRSEDANEIKNIVNANSADSETRITANEAQIGINTPIVTSNTGRIDTNEQNIGSNRSDIDNNTGDIGTNQTAIGTNITNININTGRIGTNETNISANEGNLTTHVADVANPHAVTKAQVGLTDADDTSDADKPVSTATQNALNLKQNIATNANVRAAVDIASAAAGDFWLFRLPNTTQSRMFVVVIQYHRPTDAGRFGKSVTLSVGLGNTSGLPDRGGSIVQTGGFGVTSGMTGVFARFVGGQYYLGFTSALNGGTARIAISVHGPDAQDVDFSVLNGAASGANLAVVVPTVINAGLNLLTTEQDLGLPAFNGDILSSNTLGARTWVERGATRRNAWTFGAANVVDDWYRICQTPALNIWGENALVQIVARLGNNTQSFTVGWNSSYNTSRPVVLQNNFGNSFFKSVRTVWVGSRWAMEIQASTTGAPEMWFSVVQNRSELELFDGIAGGGQVYGSASLATNIPPDPFAHLIATPETNFPPINELGGEQDPPEMTAAQAEDYNSEVAESILLRQQADALDTAYFAEADLTKEPGADYVKTQRDTPPDNAILTKTDYINNGVDPKYL